MPTIFEQKNADFSERAHKAAQTKIYPHIFDKFPVLRFESTTMGMGEYEGVLDGRMGIDRVLYAGGFNSGLKMLPITIQERFRDTKYISYKDITITEWNHETDQPSELYKLHANIFVYGYYDPKANDFDDWIVINAPNLLMAIAQNNVRFTRRGNEKRQSFIAITFDELARHRGVVIERCDPSTRAFQSLVDSHYAMEAA